MFQLGQMPGQNLVPPFHPIRPNCGLQFSHAVVEAQLKMMSLLQGHTIVLRQSVWDKLGFLLMDTFPVDLGSNTPGHFFCKTFG